MFEVGDRVVFPGEVKEFIIVETPETNPTSNTHYIVDFSCKKEYSHRPDEVPMPANTINNMVELAE